MEVRTQARGSGKGRAPVKHPGEPVGPDGRGRESSGVLALRAAGYVRISQERNLRDGYGMDAQVVGVERHIEYKEWKLVKIYRENGVSGYIRERPALDCLLADAKEGKFDVAVFPSIDRAARSVTNMIEIDDALREANVTVVFIREGVDTSTPMGQFFRNICASIAQFEGKLIYERMSKGKRRKAAQGGYCGGWLPYGYRRGKRRAVVVEEEAAVVREIFEWRLGGQSFSRIARELRRRGVKTKRGGRWGYSTVWRIVRCPLYAGWNRYGDGHVRGLQKPVISVKAFNKAQMVFHSAADRRLHESKRLQLPEGT